MEIEAKFSILDRQTELALAKLPCLAGYHLGEAEVHDLFDTYLDTNDHAIIRAGYACRHRSENGASRITLKGIKAGGEVVHQREELEVPIDDCSVPVPEQWPDSPARDLVLKLANGEELVELFAVRQRRESRFLSAGDVRVAELSVDSVSLEGPSRTQHFTELEVELLTNGTETDLASIVQGLSKLPGLVPQLTSKFERGYALTYRKAHKGAALQLGNVSLDDTMAEATRKILRPHFLRMLTHERGTYLGEDPEELHDMRVATRRMRTALRMAGPYLDAPSLSQIRDDLEKVADVLGDVRDMDVFREKAERYIVKAGLASVDFAPLAHVWNVEYARRRNKMLDFLTTRRYNNCKRAFWSKLEDELPQGEENAYVRDVIPKIVREQLAAFRHGAAKLRDEEMSLSAYHALRISGKRLRYTLEFFRNVLGPTASAAIEALKELQDYLGDLQDTRVAVGHLRAVIDFGTWEAPLQPAVLWQATADGEPGAAANDGPLESYLRTCEDRIKELVSGSTELWRRIDGDAIPALIEEALEELQTPAPMAATVSSVRPTPLRSPDMCHDKSSTRRDKMPQKPTYVILMGPPASGKGTQAERLGETLDLPHVASGDLFRDNLKNETPLGLRAKQYMDQGELVPDDITIAMVLDRLSQPDCQKGALLDGFPRTVAQAQALDEALAEQGRAIDLVLNIQVPEEELIARVTGRRLCRNCGASYHIEFKPPKEPGICDKCGGELYQRDDDTEETARKRLEVYEEQTKPVLDYYDEKDILVAIDGDQSIDEVTQTLRAAIEKHL